MALLAVKMALGTGDEVVHEVAAPSDPDKLAVYPLAVPYLFNPVGITVLIIASEAPNPSPRRRLCLAWCCW